MLQARPLYDNVADAKYFVRPSAWATLMRALERRLNVLLTGERGAGKTTLLRQLQSTLRTEGHNIVFVDATALESSLDLVRRIRDALRGQPSSAQEGSATLTATALPDAAPVAGASRALQAELRAVGEAEPATVLVDASDAGNAVYEVFGRLRDTLWQFEHLWLVAVDEDERATALRPPADSFFDVVVGLGRLSSDELTTLLELRSSDSSRSTLRLVAENARGNPRRAIRALGDAFARGADPASTLAARSQLETQASTIGRPHGMLMAELLERGQASASDDAVQRSLGITRARLNQLLRELLDHKLVIQDVEAPSGPGRPRTIYRPALR
ncbi:MAG TPA: ATP-binding protein [Solirubrobacteraceae bacterium]|nr:ATP-binding protein [Solirubrobacteraceae bacterium]